MPSRDSNSGLPYSKPTRYYLRHAAPLALAPGNHFFSMQMQAVSACYTERGKLRARDNKKGLGRVRAGRRGMEPMYKNRKRGDSFHIFLLSTHFVQHTKTRSVQMCHACSLHILCNKIKYLPYMNSEIQVSSHGKYLFISTAQCYDHRKSRHMNATTTCTSFLDRPCLVPALY